MSREQVAYRRKELLETSEVEESLDKMSKEMYLSDLNERIFSRAIELEVLDK